MLKELFGSIFGGTANSAIKNVSVNDTQEALKDKNVQFIDVRTIAEYKSGHAKKAINFPLDTLETRFPNLIKINLFMLFAKAECVRCAAHQFLKTQVLAKFTMSREEQFRGFLPDLKPKNRGS